MKNIAKIREGAMKRALKGAAVLLSLTFVFSLCACGAGSDSDFETAFDTSFGTVFVMLSNRDSDGKNVRRAELESIARQSAEAAEEAYVYYTSSASVNDINKGVDASLDCDADFISELKSLCALSDATNGAFQPCGGAYTALFADGNVPDDAAKAAALEKVGTDKFTFSDTAVFKSDKEVKIDLTPAAYGYALEAAAKVLKDSGVSHGVFSLSSGVYVFGRTDDPYNIGISADGTEKCAGYLRITDGYVFYAESLECEAYRFNRTEGLDTASVAVFSQDAVQGAALAYASLASGKAGMLELYSSSGFEFEGVAVSPDGEVTVTRGAEGTIYTPETETEAEGD